MPNASGLGDADYVLWGDDGKPLAVVEAKKTTVDPAAGRQQAKLYADCLEAMHGQRPVIFYTNGYETYLWDDRAYAPRSVAGFHKKDHRMGENALVKYGSVGNMRSLYELGHVFINSASYYDLPEQHNQAVYDKEKISHYRGGRGPKGGQGRVPQE